MEIIIAIISILLITLAVKLINKALPFKVCPICAGVSLTWFLIIVGTLTGQLTTNNYQLITAILMGGTVVGIAYQGEKRFKWAEENIFRFKVPVVVIGFALVYLALENLSWSSVGIEAALLLILFYFFFISGNKNNNGPAKEVSPKVKELEEKMKNCC